ncbi:MAG: sodium:calcium antiporter [Acidimicrobiales bacterium]
MSELVLWQLAAVFLVGAGVLVRAAVTLAKAGDQIALTTGLSGLLVGTLFLALATSLPELVTDVSAAVASAPNLAVGDLFGSSMANMAILAVIDLRHHGRVWPTVELGHARVAAVAIALTAFAALGVLTPPGWSLGWVGLDTLAVAGMYIAAVAWFRRGPVMFRRSEVPAGLQVPTGWSEPELTDAQSSRAAIRQFVFAALAILAAAPLVAVSARGIADQAGIAQTTVGAGLLAITTSLPELVASLAAVRIGAHDLAAGNLFGSCALNMAVLFVADVAYTKGPILAAVDPSQAVAAVGAMFLMALALAAIVGGSETRIGRLEPDAILLLLAYLGALVAVGVAAS